MTERCIDYMQAGDGQISHLYCKSNTKSQTETLEIEIKGGERKKFTMTALTIISKLRFKEDFEMKQKILAILLLLVILVAACTTATW
jgi:ABC-type lipoprotein release transport system permease subunit